MVYVEYGIGGGGCMMDVMMSGRSSNGGRAHGLASRARCGRVPSDSHIILSGQCIVFRSWQGQSNVLDYEDFLEAPKHHQLNVGITQLPPMSNGARHMDMFMHTKYNDVTLS